MKRIIYLSLFTLFTISLAAQSIGIRAGINFSTLKGPLENGETFGLTNGIHFGVSYGYKFSPKFMIRTELLYAQKGGKQKFLGDGYYLIYTPDKTVFEKGRDSFNLNISNAYLNLPIVAAYQLTKKWEIYGGISPGLLISPTARGTLTFTSKDHPSDILFTQSLVYNYGSDKALASSAGVRDIRVIVNGEIVTIPKIAHAYYQTDFVPENYFNKFDLNTVAGVNYFFNKGFYGGVRFEYGLLDATSNKVDYSRASLNPDKTLIKRSDFDHNFDLSFSLGFRF